MPRTPASFAVSLVPATLALASLATAAHAVGCTRAAPDARPSKEPVASTVSVTPVPPASVAVAGDASAGAGEIDARFTAELKTVFTTYKGWGRVDDELRWAPFLCRIPQPGRAAMSAADEGGHARKLYSLFAKNRGAYVGMRAADARPPSTVGQVIVKESFVPEVVKVDAGEAAHGRVITDGGLGEADHFDPYVTENGTTYRASTLAGVYVMLRKEPSTAGTDDGWVYGTMKPTGEVTSAGRVSSCMGCHGARPGRLFGRAAKHARD